VLNYDDLVELASLCARNSRIATSRDVADELWRMAKEYQAQAAKLGGVSRNWARTAGVKSGAMTPAGSTCRARWLLSPGHAAAR
jgi:hypothetical protein